MAYFKYLTALRQGEYSFNMKIIEIEKHIYEGIRRSQPREWTEMERRLYGSSMPITQKSAPKEIDEDETLKEAEELANTKIIKLLIELENKVNSLYGKQFSKDVIDAVMNRIVMVHEGTRELNPMEYQD